MKRPTLSLVGDRILKNTNHKSRFNDKRIFSYFLSLRFHFFLHHLSSIMLPSHSPEVQSQTKPPQTLNFVRTHVSSHPCLWLFITFLLIQILVISFTHNPPPCFPDRTAAVSATTSAAECASGRVYVYDLPSIFNRDILLHNCSDLDPWNWQCGIAANHGYGGPAAELRRILPENLSKAWYRTNQFALELIFHHRILNHKCRTLEPESATSFYIPFYAGLAVGKYLWMNDTSKRDWHCKMMLEWVQKQRYWKRSNGSDHFMAIGRITWDFRRLTDPGKIWGSTFLNMPAMKEVTRFIIEKAPGDVRDVSVPYPTGFHPKTKEILKEWQNFARGYNRSSLFTFIGATRGWVNHDFRGLLLNYCYSEPGSCRVVDCAAAPCPTDSSVILEALLGSEFCLQPRGDSFTRRSVFDCMVAGSVPVFFWKRTAYDQYEGFLPGEPESYSVYIHHEEVRNETSLIKEVLMKYSKEEIRKKREKVIETIPRIIYGIMTNEGLTNFKDAFDVAVDGVLERIKEEKDWSQTNKKD
ncbi:Acetylglucosaminyltransferase EXT1/exostosin 1 [Handroanthus impetiginosus]|uniref:Acetylglucosaminyltransferase EXT1/exostosin 1 n=1 Tax=Handroanthus impetiginosus TaxID=429701 RepID=A0A2G9HX15_9LAMI|nr:Acetylglucosaminyltransferase EXT1/exostosin 1 [Handroanthus impetiginosus]